jgi:hypothetical protein
MTNMNPCLKAMLPVALAAGLVLTAMNGDAMAYNPKQSDLLLLFRSDLVGNNVEVDLGSVTNLLNLPAGAVTNFAPVYNAGQVKANIDNSFGTVLFSVAGVDTAGRANSLWLTCSPDAAAPANLAKYRFPVVRNLIETIGTDAATATGYAASPSYMDAASSRTAYTYLVTIGQGLSPSDMANWGGAVSFSVEAPAGRSLNLYQFNNSGAGQALLVGTVAMDAASGAVTFTRAGK